MSNLYGGGSGTISSGSAVMPGRGFVNAAFSIRIVSPNDDIQEKPQGGRPNPSEDLLDNLEIGTEVSFIRNHKSQHGRVQRIVKNGEGDVTHVMVKVEDGRTHKVEATHLRIEDSPDLEDDREEAKLSAPAVFNENVLLSFSEFCLRHGD